MIELITSNNDIEHPKNWLSERAEVVCIPTIKKSGTTLNPRTLTQQVRSVRIIMDLN